MSKKFSHVGQAFSQLGQAFMLPIAILPVAGLLLGLGGALTNKAAVGAYPWLNQEWLQTILKVMNFAGSAVFNNLALIFSIGLAVGLAKGDKGTAGLAGGVAYLVYTATISGLLQMFSPKNTIDTGVLGAIVIGCVVAYLHNHYRKVELPQFLGFFGGSRFIPIISSLAAILIGAIFFIIWPPIQSGLTSAGYAIAKMGSFGSFLYGFLLRLTGAVGLHHTIYPMFWYTALGGTADVAGKTVVGAQNIFFAQLADPNHHGLFTYGTRFFAGRFATMMFGLPGAALAMYLCLPKRNRKTSGGLYLSGGLTSFLTGITEPIDFTYLFAAPVLWIVYSVMAATMNTVMWCFGLRGLMSDGAIGIASMNWLPLWANHWHIYVMQFIVGIVFGLLTYFIFKIMIEKFNYVTPGREADDEDVKLINKKEYKEKMAQQKAAQQATGVDASDPYIARAQAYLELLGGPSNIEELSSCATRLRVTVKDPDKLGSDAQFRANKAVNVVHHGKAIQVIVGLDVAQVLERMQTLIEKAGQSTKVSQEQDPEVEQAIGFIDLLGGRNNIKKLISCSTRIRVEVYDLSKVADDAHFKDIGAHEVTRRDNEIDIVIGLNADSIVDKMKENM